MKKMTSDALRDMNAEVDHIIDRQDSMMKIISYIVSEFIPKLGTHCQYCGNYIEDNYSHDPNCKITKLMEAVDVSNDKQENTNGLSRHTNGESTGILKQDEKVLVKEDKEWWLGKVVEYNYVEKYYDILNLVDHRHYTIEEDKIHLIPDFVTTLEHALKYVW